MIQQYDIPFTRNSEQHKVLHMLRTESLTTAQILKKMGRSKSKSANLRVLIGELARKKFVTSYGHDHWQLTDIGVDACLVLGGEPVPNKRLVKRTPSVVGVPYDGAELGRTCLRPGAYDYLECPSVSGGMRRWWRQDALTPVSQLPL